MQKTWKRIFVGYTGTSKHLRVWVSRIHQVLIASEPIVNKSKRGTDLLIEHPLPSSEKPLRPQTGKLKPRGQPHKKPRLEDIIIKENAREKNASRDELIQVIV